LFAASLRICTANSHRARWQKTSVCQGICSLSKMALAGGALRAFVEQGRLQHGPINLQVRSLLLFCSMVVAAASLTRTMCVSMQIIHDLEVINSGGKLRTKYVSD
jgi:hypothetical protein